MKGPLLELHWKDQLVGVISDATVSDFPWLAGKFAAKRVSKQLREVMTWFAAQAEADELAEPPFGPELLEDWVIVKADGTWTVLDGVPLVDLKRGSIEWRE
jgi:hypothetical protein